MNTSNPPHTRDRGQLLAWVNRQKSAPLSTAQAAALDSLYPEWRTTTLNGAWYTRLESVEEFVATYARFPRAKADDPVEKSAGIWLATQRQRVGSMTAERRKVIDERLPGWCLTPAGQTRDSRWEASLQSLTEFYSSQDRLPAQKAANPAEAKLAAWLATQRKNAETMSDARLAALDSGLPAWRQSRDDAWTEQLHKVADYLREHRYFPRSSKDASVRSMASWMSNQRAAAGALSAERIAALNEHIPLWRDRTIALWQHKLDLAAAHVAATGNLPRTSSPNSDESKLAFWLGYQRKHRDKLTAEQIGSLNERVPGWLGQSRTTCELAGPLSAAA